MIIEMRTYRIKPGGRAKFIEIFNAKVAPEHKKLGIPVLGPFPSVEDEDVFFWMRGFPDLASRERLKNAFYEGKLWKSELEGVLLPMLEKYDVALVEAPENLWKWN
jgi:hypothetical protein